MLLACVHTSTTHKHATAPVAIGHSCTHLSGWSLWVSLVRCATRPALSTNTQSGSWTLVALAGPFRHCALCCRILDMLPPYHSDTMSASQNVLGR